MLTTMGLATATVLLPARLALGASEKPQRIDIGRLALGQRLVHELHIENTDEIPLDVARVTSTCKCVKILEHPEVVMPGDKETIRAEVLVNVPGDYAFGIQVHPWDPNGNRRSFLLLVTVPRPKESNPTLYVSASDLQGGAPPRAAFVDVRRAPSGTATVPGAVRLPLHAVKTVRSLRNRPVILVDNGWRSPGTELACFQLQQQGFTSVRILDGGVQAWQAVGGAVTGHCSEPCDTLSPGDYPASRSFTEWIVVDADRVSGNGMLPDSPVLVSSAPGNIDRTVSAVRALTAKHPGLAHVLVIGQSADPDRGMAHALRETIDGAVVFRLEGGREGLVRYQQAVETRMSDRSVRTSRTVGGRRPIHRTRRACGGCS